MATGFYQDIPIDKLKASPEDPAPTGHEYKFRIRVALRTEDENETAQGRIAIWEMTPSRNDATWQPFLAKPTWQIFSIQRVLKYGDTHTVRCEIYLDTPDAEYLLDDAKFVEV